MTNLLVLPPVLGLVGLIVAFIIYQMVLKEDAGDGVQWRSTLPSVVRFTANGLVLDGGVVVLSHPLVSRQHCLVLSLPLGMTRVGTYKAASNGRLRSDACRPDAHD